ncbi:MAG TPA: hypothetical protein VKH43_11295, partial [Thermoanaerobaculia bacterium]|nr:hypothetical protein [Thermoanaerobaculia bacterium]
DPFCPFVLEIFYLGITTGTTATTYSPAANVTRVQMAAFLSRSVDGVLRRGSARAILGQSWTTQSSGALGLTTLGAGGAQLPACDGTDVWAVRRSAASVARVRASDGRLLETWTGIPAATAAAVSPQGILVPGSTFPAKLFRIDPSLPPGGATEVIGDLGMSFPGELAADGGRIWVIGDSGVAIVTPHAALPWTVTTVTAGFSVLEGVLFDGANVWVTDNSPGTLLRLGSAGQVLQTVTVGLAPLLPVFDGTNLWVPSSGDSTLSVVRAATGAVLATLTGFGLASPVAAAFDGEKILVINGSNQDSVSLWNAAGLSPLGSFSTGANTQPSGACSDGVNFWITLFKTGQLARF